MECALCAGRLVERLGVICMPRGDEKREECDMSQDGQRRARRI